MPVQGHASDVQQSLEWKIEHWAISLNRSAPKTEAERAILLNRSAPKTEAEIQIT